MLYSHRGNQARCADTQSRAATRSRGLIDEIASELPVRLVLNNEPLVTLLCTPAELEELAVGFLLSEGLLRDKASIKKLEVDEREAAVRIELTGLPADFSSMFEKRTISSGCGKGVTFTNYRMYADSRIQVEGRIMSLDAIRKLLAEFRTISKLYLETGGVHSAALSDGESILFFSEDIGRHNAVDKLIGKAFLRSVSVENKILLTSGRVTSEIVTKVRQEPLPRPHQPGRSVVHGRQLCRRHGNHARGLCARRPHEHLHVAEPDHLIRSHVYEP